MSKILHETIVNQKSKVSQGLATACLYFEDFDQEDEVDVVAEDIEVTMVCTGKYQVHFCYSQWSVPFCEGRTEPGDVAQATMLFKCDAPTTPGWYKIRGTVRRTPGLHDITLRINSFEPQAKPVVPAQDRIVEDTAVAVPLLV